MANTNKSEIVASIESANGKLRGVATQVTDASLHVMGLTTAADRTEAYVSVLTATLSKFESSDENLNKTIESIMKDTGKAQLLLTTLSKALYTDHMQAIETEAFKRKFPSK